MYNTLGLVRGWVMGWRTSDGVPVSLVEGREYQLYSDVSAYRGPLG